MSTCPYPLFVASSSSYYSFPPTHRTRFSTWMMTPREASLSIIRHRRRRRRGWFCRFIHPSYWSLTNKLSDAQVYVLISNGPESCFLSNRELASRLLLVWRQRQTEINRDEKRTRTKSIIIYDFRWIQSLSAYYWRPKWWSWASPSLNPKSDLLQPFTKTILSGLSFAIVVYLNHRWQLQETLPETMVS